MTTIHITTAEGAQYLVAYTPQDSLSSLRDKIQALHGVSLHNREFYCNGLPVPEGQMLQGIGISPQHRLTVAAPRAGMHVQVTPSQQQLSPQQRGYRISPSAAASAGTTQQPPLMVNTAGKYSPQTSPQHSPAFYQTQPLPTIASHTQSPMRNVAGGVAVPAAINTSSSSRSRSGSVSSHAQTMPAAHPAPSERRRHSVSMPGATANPFEQLEKTLKKVEKHEKQHPIPSELYDKEQAKNGAANAPPTTSSSSSSSSSTGSSSGSSSSSSTTTHSPSSHSIQSLPGVEEIKQDSLRPKTPDRSPKTLPLKSSGSSSHLNVSPHPKHVQPSPPGSPGSGGGTRPRSRSAAEAAPSVTSFQPILSYSSKITALEIALQELVEEREHLDKKTAEERTRIEGVITERKKELEEVIWNHQKRMHIVSAMVDDWNARKASVEEELARTKQQQIDQVKHYEELVAQRQAEIDRIRLEAKQAEIQREGVLEEVKTKIAQYTAVRDDVRRDSDRAMEMSVRGIVDALVRGGVMDVVEAEIKARKPH